MSDVTELAPRMNCCKTTPLQYVILNLIRLTIFQSTPNVPVYPVEPPIMAVARLTAAAARQMAKTIMDERGRTTRIMSKTSCDHPGWFG